MWCTLKWNIPPINQPHNPLLSNRGCRCVPICKKENNSCYHSHNTATQFISKYTQDLLFCFFFNYLKLMFQYKSRSPPHSMKTRLWIEKKMFRKHFQYRCLSKGWFQLERELSLVCSVGLGSDNSFCTAFLFRGKTSMHLKISVWRAYF